jgi:hypothetical protein
MWRALLFVTLSLSVLPGALLPVSAQAQVELTICRRTNERCFECGRVRTPAFSIGPCMEREIDACAPNEVCYRLSEIPHCIPVSGEVCCPAGEPCMYPPVCAGFMLGAGCHGDPGLPGQTCYCDPPTAEADAGPPEIDAGPPEIDAGPPEIDAGPPEIDAGSPPPMDAGPPTAPVRYYGGGLGSCSAAPGRSGSGLTLWLLLALCCGLALRRRIGE